MIARNRLQFRTSQSKAFTGKRHRRTIVAAAAVTLSLVSWGFVCSRLSYLPSFSIYSVQVYGADEEVSHTLLAAAYRTLHGSYAGIFSRANTMIYPKDELIAAVAAMTPRIDTVKVERDGRHTLRVTVTEKAPAAIVCADLPDWDGGEPAASERCYVADRTGKVIRAMAGEGDNETNRYYAPALPADPIGSFATSTQEFQALESFFRSVRTTGIVPKALLIKDAGEYELFVANPGDTGDVTIVYFNTASDLSVQLSNLSAFWNSMTTKAKADDRKVDFEYIDVRYGSNVFYRTADETI